LVISLAVHGQSSSLARVENDESFPSTLADCPEEDQVTYTAAALEFEPTRDWTNAASGEDILRANVESIYEFIKIAKEYGTDIFVSPEYGLQSVDMYTNDSLRFQSLTQQVPDPALAVVPCDDDEQLQNYDIIRNLSCIAREQEMYLVVDVAEQISCETSVAPCQTDDLTFFNTQVVFDRTGQIIARYRKQNLYLEPQFAPGPSDDASAIFTTDFGVKFSLQVCFDITFSHPGYSNVMNEGIKDIVMSTAWVDVNPFLLGISVQNGWSRGLGVNLIVSGYHFPEKSKLGSGVFRGYSDLTSSYTFDPNSGNVVIIQPVTTCRSAPASKAPVQTLSEP
ncbi:Carbon-nitrogen hydrolase, partial [Trinorchestia longiramus]